MRLRRHPLSALALLACLAVPGALAFARTADQPWPSSVDAAQFAEQAAAVQEEMKPGGRFGAIGAADRSEVERNLGVVQKLFDERGAASRMNNREQVQLANAQEKINALLTGNDDERLICTLEQRSGTHFKTKICQTARQRREVTRQSQEGYQRQLMQGGPSQTVGD
ncbi:MAG: hypothetical protein KIS89_07700 [Dokdonella sp.]|uniref:hypothetical protein n=1 Tax=Dokdonella sp. TaxID=2291710 RepID=UPI0027BB0B48|nr:hypothetical protein [Dokdonella sp.]MCW5578511.1 hypothetical protein [Dokdonella sp.]